MGVCALSGIVLREIEMAKFKCRHCGEVKKVDLREPMGRYFLTKAGRYKSYCTTKNKTTFMERVK
jgi:hypothetical protein